MELLMNKTNIGLSQCYPAATQCLIWHKGWKEKDRILCLHRNPLHNITGDLLMPPIVEPCGAWIAVASQILHIFQRYSLC